MNPNFQGEPPYQPTPPGPYPQQPNTPQAVSQPQPQFPPQASFGYQQSQPQQPGAQPQFSPQPQFQPQLPTATLPDGAKAPHRSKLWTILAIVFIITTLIGGGLSTWALINYFDQKNNVDSKVSSAVADAVKKQRDTDDANYAIKEKEPNRQFAGPDDYGHLTFDYPKTWSIYVDKDASSGGTYAAYFSPISVPPVSDTERYALRVTIEDQDYDKVVDSYKSLVTKGSLVSSSFALDSQDNGTRLDGDFTKDIRGSAVIFKIRDKTVTLRTDAQTFETDFNALIKTIQFNK